MIDEEEWTEEHEAFAKEFGEKFAADAIAFARRRYRLATRQARELQFWLDIAKAFPASSVYSRPILTAEINRLEK